MKKIVKKKIPSEALFLESGSLWSDGCFPMRRDCDENSLPLIVLEVEGEDRSRCLSRASLIRFRATGPTSDLEPPIPRSLYMTTTTISSSSAATVRVGLQGRIMDAWRGMDENEPGFFFPSISRYSSPDYIKFSLILGNQDPFIHQRIQREKAEGQG